MKALASSIVSNIAYWDGVYRTPNLSDLFPAPPVSLVSKLSTSLPKDGHVLMPGAGLGLLAAEVGKRRPDLRWTITDYSSVAMERAAMEWPLSVPVDDGCFFVRDVDSFWPYPDECFDAVILSDLLEYVEKPEHVVAEAYRVACSALAITLSTQSRPAHRWHYDMADAWRLIPGSPQVQLLDCQMMIGFAIL